MFRIPFRGIHCDAPDADSRADLEVIGSMLAERRGNLRIHEAPTAFEHDGEHIVAPPEVMDKSSYCD